MMRIENSILEDLPEIMELYDLAVILMKSKKQVSWPKFPQKMIEDEINSKNQWKLIIDEEIACIWATTDNDPIIWGEKNHEPSIYIHRIATNPKFKGNNLVGQIVEWAKKFAKNGNKCFVRMDTVGLNTSLINHYQKFGFEFLGTRKLSSTEGLPEHYQKEKVCLFELKV